MKISFPLNSTVVDRFMRYVRIDTQSDPSSDSIPSTEKQKDLGKVLVNELTQIGVIDAYLDEYGYVYATIPAIWIPRQIAAVPA
jgi:tripeptide aminopeptidase